MSDPSQPERPSNAYHRPHDKWICGRLGQGCPCLSGPSAEGKCRTTKACMPFHKQGQWECSRSDAEGGKCPQGPSADGQCCVSVPPCSPQRSLRSYRGLLTVGVLLVTVALLLIFFTGNADSKWTSPGKVTSAHAGIEADCRKCHRLSEGEVLGELQLAEHLSPDSGLCLECHDLGEHPFHAHGVSQSEMAAIAERHSFSVSDSGKAPFLVRLSKHLSLRQKGEMGELDCSSCHKEHRGRDHDLHALTNQQCQSCHQQQFDSFAKGHPEFSDYPYRRRTRIQFDHSKHLNQYFKEAKHVGNGPGSCASCHELDSQGKGMLLKGYEMACIRCHDTQIKGDGRPGEKGLAFLRLPGLDTLSLEENGLTAGEWPEYAEGELTPHMRFILEGNYLEPEALERIQKMDMQNLENADDADLQLAEAYGWAIKEMLFDLQTQGHRFLVDSIGEFDPDLLGQLPMEAINAAQREWLPNLHKEVSYFRMGTKPEVNKNRPVDSSVSGASMLSESDDSGDDFNLLEEDDDGSLLGDDEDAMDLLGGDALEGDLLGEDEESADLLGGIDESESDLLLGDGEDMEGLLEENSQVESDAIAAGKSPPVVEFLKGGDWVNTGGWYRNDLNYTLYYRPTGHADFFLRAWIEKSAETATEYDTDKALFEHLTGEGVVGLCSKCHSIDEGNSVESLRVHWLANRPTPYEHSFNMFSHLPHLNGISDAGCQSCHVLDEKANYQESFGANRNPHVFMSNFVPMNKADCARCHQPEVAQDGCLQCHNYHTGNFSSNLAEKAARR